MIIVTASLSLWHNFTVMIECLKGRTRVQFFFKYRDFRGIFWGMMQKSNSEIHLESND